jgi:hypothetical protein
MQAHNPGPSLYPTDATAWPSCSTSACRRASASAAVVILCGGQRTACSQRPQFWAQESSRRVLSVGASLAGVSVPICSVPWARRRPHVRCDESC